MAEPPVVLCEQIAPKRPGGVPTLRFWCPFCRQIHLHGGRPGHRIAHCYKPSSPYYDTGYILKVVAPAVTMSADGVLSSSEDR